MPSPDLPQRFVQKTFRRLNENPKKPFMNISRFLGVVLVATTLTGCSTELIRRTEATPESARAYAIGKYETSCSPYNEKLCMPPFVFSILYRNAHESEIEGGLYFGLDAQQYFDNRKKIRGRYFCIPLPAGDYQVYNLRFNNAGAIPVIYELRKENYLDLPFSVGPGEVVYLGTLKLSTETGKNWLGMSLPLPGMLLLSSQPQADIARALQECPASVRNRHVRIAPLDPAEAHSIVVRADPNP